jgi:hypothetical protein
MHTKRAVDWEAIGETLLTPEVLGAIIGGTGAPLAAYLVRRKKEMPKWRRIAELLGAGVLGAGVGAVTGHGGRELERAYNARKLDLLGWPVGAVEAGAVGGILAPLATYLARRKKDVSTMQMLAELLGMAALGTGFGAGIGRLGLKTYWLI